MPRLTLTDRQWRCIAPLLPGKRTDPGRTGFNNRMAFEGMIHVLRTGTPWRDMPEEFGKWITVYMRFRRWTKRGVFKRLSEQLGERNLKTIMIDGTFVKLHQHGAGARRNGLTPAASAVKQKIGRSRGGLTTKLMFVVDARGRVVRFFLHPGNRAEGPLLIDAVKGIETDELIADKAFHGRPIRSYLEAHGIKVVIPAKSNDLRPVPHDEDRYNLRHLVENLFADLKQYRGFATRYAKTASSFEAFVNLAVYLDELRKHG